MGEQLGTLVLTGSLAALGLFVYLFNTRPYSEQDIPSLPSILPFANAWQFFTKRHDFIRSGFAKVKQNMFRFNVNQVIKIHPIAWFTISIIFRTKWS